MSGFITAVWSPKGGVGKTLLSVALAMQVAQRQKTVLVDGNADNPDLVSLIQCPNVPNVCTWPGTPEAGTIENHLVRRSSRLFLLPGPTRYVDEGALNKDVMETVLRSLRTAGYSVVVDLSCSLRDSTLVALDLADRIILPVTLDLLSLTPLIRIVREQDFLKLPVQKFRVVINRQTDTREITPEDIREHSFCPVSGMIPSSKVVAGAINRGDCEAALGPSSPIGRALAGFLSDLLPVDALKEGGRGDLGGGLLDRLKGLTGREST